ncbi:MAG: DUF1049 domain-containing protein [Bradyrhizobium sp.]|nr:DUF1049 domain-containing protein [Bradyrhizobium sp.]
MRKFVNAVTIVPLFLLFMVFAVANRHLVTVSLDPFNSKTPAFAVSLPLFVLMIAAAILGAIAGGCATWFRQRHWRRAARRHEADARSVRAELADLRATTLTTWPETKRLGAPVQGGFYATSRRDKQGATL